MNENKLRELLEKADKKFIDWVDNERIYNETLAIVRTESCILIANKYKEILRQEYENNSTKEIEVKELLEESCKKIKEQLDDPETFNNYIGGYSPKEACEVVVEGFRDIALSIIEKQEQHSQQQTEEKFFQNMQESTWYIENDPVDCIPVEIGSQEHEFLWNLYRKNKIRALRCGDSGLYKFIKPLQIEAGNEK